MCHYGIVKGRTCARKAYEGETEVEESEEVKCEQDIESVCGREEERERGRGRVE